MSLASCRLGQRVTPLRRHARFSVVAQMPRLAAACFKPTPNWACAEHSRRVVAYVQLLWPLRQLRCICSFCGRLEERRQSSGAQACPLCIPQHGPGMHPCMSGSPINLTDGKTHRAAAWTSACTSACTSTCVSEAQLLGQACRLTRQCSGLSSQPQLCAYQPAVHRNYLSSQKYKAVT